MLYTLYLCEKPSQAKDIARNLGATKYCDGYIENNQKNIRVTWCIGHLLTLAEPKYYCENIKPWRIEILPIIPKHWEMIVSSKTKKQFEVIKQLLKNTNHLIIATDSDREGEAIARELIEICQYQGKIGRLWLSALDDASIQKALKQLKPGKDTEKLYLAALGRQRADWLIGMNMTMAASCLYGVNVILSIGRVQTPTLKLVVDRDREIENFRPKDYFVLQVLFESQKNNNTFWTTWLPNKKLVDEQNYCLNYDIVEAIAAKIEGESGIVSEFNETKKKQEPPLGFSLSALQKKASSLFGFSAKKTLETAQALYEVHKTISYPRTDCAYLPEEQFTEAENILASLRNIDPALTQLILTCNPKYKSAIWNDKKITAHHAIIPTLNKQVDLAKMADNELRLYDLICRQYIAQFLDSYEYLYRAIQIQCTNELFQATCLIPQKLGWKAAFDKNTLEPETHHKKENDQIQKELPVLNKNERVLFIESNIDHKKTQPLAHFTDGSLIEAMKTIGKYIENKHLMEILKDSHGIGTEATRANILEILFKRGYLERKKKQIFSTSRGRALVDLVPDSVKNPITTAIWEQQLDQITQGKFTLDNFIKTQTDVLKKMLAALINEKDHKQKAILQLKSDTQNNKVYLCPKCQSPLRQLRRKNKANSNGKIFWGCSHYPNCKFTCRDQKGKPII